MEKDSSIGGKGARPFQDQGLAKGRGAQYNPTNPYLKNEYVVEHQEGLDEPWERQTATQFFKEFPKTIVNEITSPDLGLSYSMNPYQGCEHGCIYCYARNTHAYWGLGAGLDFEQKIIVKENAPEVLQAQLEHPKWEVRPIMLAGNTDCYQPIEAKKKITRRLLEVLLQYRHPVSLITKNALILRDLDLLTELHSRRLLHVNISITTLDEDLRQKLEPRTSTGAKRLQVVKSLSEAGLPVNVMVAPIIPGLNDHEVPAILEASAAAGALSAAYTIVRLNGAVGETFEDWVHKAYPDRASKVLNQIKSCHGGTLNDSQFGRRMAGEGRWAETIKALFKVSLNKHFKGRSMPPYDMTAFTPRGGKQLNLF
ncbi:PA0069 family radical SAM protein [Rufibacter latericius]|uniref:PA0069 family radical SAM protein n=1 Tax=Rufibacter latericius TaxID=2487040 RepID=A0A3M9M8C4_9BACT|nr:PA0069 family radical SAM protein [Rufibacter latericius]RNI21824.1 PA0069 family radical SAM protein [Rufibacter latericius]